MTPDSEQAIGYQIILYIHSKFADFSTNERRDLHGSVACISSTLPPPGSKHGRIQTTRAKMQASTWTIHVSQREDKSSLLKLQYCDVEAFVTSPTFQESSKNRKNMNDSPEIDDRLHSRMSTLPILQDKSWKKRLHSISERPLEWSEVLSNQTVSLAPGTSFICSTLALLDSWGQQRQGFILPFRGGVLLFSRWRIWLIWNPCE